MDYKEFVRSYKDFPKKDVLFWDFTYLLKNVEARKSAINEIKEFLKDKKILNLTGKTNTDLKLEYGAANLTYLSECDENYTTLSRTLNTYSARLYELGYESEARKVLEFAVETGSDSLSMYRLLADIYSGRNEADSLEYLLFKANQLDSMLKKTIVNDVSSRISK